MSLTAQQEEFLKAQRAAAANVYVCRGPCKREGRLDEAIAVWFRHALVIAVCQECFDKVDVIMTRSATGVEVKIVERSVVVIR